MRREEGQDTMRRQIRQSGLPFQEDPRCEVEARTPKQSWLQERSIHMQPSFSA
jgi:hypothetical protein